jgi:VanZ family protein
MKFLKILFRYWESLITTFVILYLSFTPPTTFDKVPSFTYEDKLVHLFLYAGLTCVLMFDFRKYANNNSSKWTFVLVCLLLPVFLGGAVEILQPIYFAPRTAEWIDWISDILGALLGWGTMALLKLTPRSFSTQSK